MEDRLIAKEIKKVSSSNMRGFQSQEKYNSFSIYLYSHFGYKDDS
ncbi:Mobile element protein [Methanosarcina siciliae C2J]|uniref:Mobile element protein n=1 Tax=Methanosarcina siciliae C2J TaxID=1434118 RepID=A0A0E3PM21_9EURY|nr:Mobile element protein [Methanosarcina siciliae C2J]